MDYYESAENLTVSRSRAVKELRDHGIVDIDEFYEDLGWQEEYQAQAVLAWLGY